MTPSPLLLVVVGESSSPTPPFSSEKTIISLIYRCNIPSSRVEIISSYDPLFSQKVQNTSARVALCLGKEAFYSLTGLDLKIASSRGYVYLPSDCKSITRTFRGIVGVYKTTRKSKTGEIIHKAGDPKLGKITVEDLPNLSPSLTYIIPTFTSHYIQRNAFSPTPAVKSDILRAWRLANDQSSILTLSEISSFFEFPHNLPITLDIETAGIGGPISHISVTCPPGQVVSVPWDHYALFNLQNAISYASEVRGHNLAFDIPKLQSEGVIFANVPRFDTMLAASLLNPDLHRGLDKAATLFLDIRPWKHLAQSNLVLYNALDSFYTHHLAEAQVDALKHMGMHNLFTKTIMPSTSVLINMTRHGIKLDLDKLSKWRENLTIKLRSFTETWTGYAPSVNPSSPHQVAKYLYETLNLTKQFDFQKKKVSVSEESINNLISLYPEHTPALSCLLNLRKCDKALKTYASVQFDFLDNCVHPSYLPYFMNDDDGYASTGRIASNSPNIQNQTPDSKSMFIPHSPDMFLLEFDFSQIELRIAAWLSNDQALIEALKGDVHARTMDILRCDRVRAKNVIYGTLYGAGPRKLARVLRSRGISASIAECESMQQSLSRAYPRLWAWRISVSTEGLSNRFLTNPFGRRRYFYAGESSIPEMYDYLPQSTAADILWELLIPLESLALAYSGRFLTTTHDSGLFEFPKTLFKSKSLYNDLISVCERKWPQIHSDFFVPIKIKTGDNWGEMLSIEET